MSIEIDKSTLDELFFELDKCMEKPYGFSMLIFICCEDMNTYCTFCKNNDSDSWDYSDTSDKLGDLMMKVYQVHSKSIERPWTKVKMVFSSKGQLISSDYCFHYIDIFEDDHELDP